MRKADYDSCRNRLPAYGHVNGYTILCEKADGDLSESFFTFGKVIACYIVLCKRVD